MSDSDEFVTAVGPNGEKRRVPKHYLDNPAFGFKLPPSARAARTDEEGEAVTPISGAEVPTETTTEVEVTSAEPTKEGTREGRR